MAGHTQFAESPGTSNAEEVTWQQHVRPNEHRTLAIVTLQAVRSGLVSRLTGFTSEGLIEPASHYLHCWDALIASLLVTSVAVASPFEFAFLKLKFDSLFVANRLVDLAFLVDMVLQFFIICADPRHPQHLLRNPKAIVWNYVCGWFVLDFCSVLPIDVILFAAFYDNVLEESNITGAFSLLRCARLLRLFRLVRIVGRWQSVSGYMFNVLHSPRFVLLLALACHWVACWWGSCAVGGQGCTWLTAVRDLKGGPHEFYQSHFDIYLLSLYWSIGTITNIGYGDIMPQNYDEYVVSSCCTALTAFLWAYFLGAVPGILCTLQPYEKEFRHTMDDLNWCVQQRSIPDKLRERLRRYFHFARHVHWQREERKVIDQMSPALQGEIALFLYGPWISRVGYLQGFDSEFTMGVARHLVVMAYAPGEALYRDRTLFLLRRGACSKKGRILSEGAYWGEDMLLSNDNLRESATVRSLSYVDVLVLYASDLNSVACKFPGAEKRLHWARIRIAMHRGMMKIGAAMKDLEIRDPVRSTGLLFAEHVRVQLVNDVLAGTFSEQDWQDNYKEGRPERHKSYLELEATPVRLQHTALGQANASTSRMFGSLSEPKSNDSSDRSLELWTLMVEVRRLVSELQLRVDRCLSPMRRPAVADN